jgi:hypothetical protein
MWLRRSELPTPFTSLISSKVKFEQRSFHQLAFDKIKKIKATEMLCSSLLSRLDLALSSLS